MQNSLDASLVRIRTANGHIVGAGFLVGERHILTCAHVVSQALGLNEYPADPPQGEVWLDFPLIAPGRLSRTRVVLWCPPLLDGRGDIAGLEVQGEPPPGAMVVDFARAGDVWEHPFRAFGFPAGYDDGVWATGRLLGRQATGWAMIEDVKTQGFAVASGFSGTPVWDTQVQGVVGMVVAASRPTETKTAFVIPLDVLVTAWPHMALPRGEPRNPYKGLRPFTQDDAGDFFGREQVVEKLVDAVAHIVVEQPAAPSKRLLTILGPSGSGKSSLVMAGLLPGLRHGALPGSEAWSYLKPMVPGKHPLEALVLTLAAQFPDRSFTSIRQDLEDEATRGLHQMAAHLLTTQKGEQPGDKVVLLVDQFEELFTQTESEDERQRFIKLLLVACSEPRGPLLVLLTLRADFYDRPMQYPELYKLIEAHQVALLAMDRHNLRRVIEQPAALPDVKLAFEGDLVENLLSEVESQAGALPLLQFTLDLLFQERHGRQLTLEAYHEIGGVKGALSQHAERTYAALPSEEHRKLARTLFLRLIDPGATEQDTTRRRAVLSEFALTDPTRTPLMRATIDAFVEARLLTTNEIAGTSTIEISHEALIREWPRLAGWLRGARDDIRLQQTISKDTAEWEQRNKPGDRLYRGSQLKEAQTWAKRNTPSSNEVAFLHASAASRVRSLVSVIAVMLLVVSSIGMASWVLTHQPGKSPVTTLVTNLQDNDRSGSLRYAVDEAPSGSTITFEAGLRGTIMLTSQLNITRNLSIRGPMARTLSVSSGTRGHRVHVLVGFSVTISNMIFKDSIIGLKSFIYNEGTLNLINSIVSGNRTDFSSGGGIYNEGTLNLVNSTVSGNRTDYSGGGGGGIYNEGMLNLVNSTVSGNRTDFGGGGGIYNDGTLSIVNSTISGNSALSTGGIYNGYEHKLGLINSTVSGNSASSTGGIYNEGTLSIVNSTVSDNSASGPIGIGGIKIVSFGCQTCFTVHVDLIFSTIYGNRGPGVADIAIKDMISTQRSQVRISNSIVSGDPAHRGPDIVGVLTSNGYNLFQDNSGADFDLATSTQYRTDRMLSVNNLTRLFASPVELRDNKGTTKTLALAPDSPAVDQVPLRFCHIMDIFNNPSRMYTDQRGVQRPDGKEDACDIGAYEYADQHA